MIHDGIFDKHTDQPVSSATQLQFATTEGKSEDII